MIILTSIIAAFIGLGVLAAWQVDRYARKSRIIMARRARSARHTRRVEPRAWQSQFYEKPLPDLPDINKMSAAEHVELGATVLDAQSQLAARPHRPRRARQGGSGSTPFRIKPKQPFEEALQPDTGSQIDQHSTVSTRKASFEDVMDDTAAAPSKPNSQPNASSLAAPSKVDTSSATRSRGKQGPKTPSMAELLQEYPRPKESGKWWSVGIDKWNRLVKENNRELLRRYSNAGKIMEGGRALPRAGGVCRECSRSGYSDCLVDDKVSKLCGHCNSDQKRCEDD